MMMLVKHGTSGGQQIMFGDPMDSILLLKGTKSEGLGTTNISANNARKALTWPA